MTAHQLAMGAQAARQDARESGLIVLLYVLVTQVCKKIHENCYFEKKLFKNFEKLKKN